LRGVGGGEPCSDESSPRQDGTLHQGISREQLAYYLDEFTFRVNRRTSSSRCLLFYRLLQQATNTDPRR
jgi:hypothetical protein